MSEPTKTPGMLSLSKISEPSLHFEITPSVKFLDLGIRADLIRTIELSSYGSMWRFHEKPPPDPNPYSWPSGYHHYWSVTMRQPCLQLTVEDLGTVKVEGDFNALLASISREVTNV